LRVERLAPVHLELVAMPLEEAMYPD
jgi:hypothetical protein